MTWKVLYKQDVLLLLLLNSTEVKYEIKLTNACERKRKHKHIKDTYLDLDVLWAFLNRHSD